MKEYKIELKEVPVPSFPKEIKPIFLNDETMKERQQKILKLMKEENLEVLVIYGDLEHGSNFEYLTGFLPRFEEALFVFHQDGKAYMLLGNENLNKVSYSRTQATAIHVPFFSLPNQPMVNDANIISYLKQADLKKGMRTGIIGWKMFTSRIEDNRKLFDVPYYFVDALKYLIGEDYLENRCDLMIGAKKGARTINNANEIAHYEFGSSLASDGILKAMDFIEVGTSELELGACLNSYGQSNNVVTIAATGERFEYANIYPSAKCTKLGDKLSLTVGYKGGLSSRSGYVVENKEQLSKKERDYLEVVAKPYYASIVAWLENIHIGMTGDELYQIINNVLPKEQYHWTLNPGHLTSDEEWMSSPIYEGSNILLKSGMMLQTDIIPSVPHFGGASCESGIVLADEQLQTQIKKDYPHLYETFMKRRQYIEDILNIKLHKDVLPMNDTVAYYRPYFLNKKQALKKL